MSTGRLIARLTAASRYRPDAPAVTFVDSNLRERPYSFRSLFARADEVATAMSRRRLGEGATMGILVGSQEAQIFHYLAALRVGAVPVILTPPNRKLNREYYTVTMEAVLQGSQFTAVVTDLESLQDVPGLLAPFTLEPRTDPAARVEREEPPSDCSFLQFTSGTTGIKRAVVVSDEAVLAQLDGYARAISLGDDDCVVSWLPLYHDMGFIACLNLPLAHGLHTVMLDPIDWVADPALFLRAASRYCATLAWNPNFAYAFMDDRIRARDIDGLALGTLRGLVNCSEPVTYESQRRFLERFATVGVRDDVFWGCYAMAETTFALTHGTSADPNYLDERGPEGHRAPTTFVSTGRPLDGVELAAVLEDGSPAGERQLGEIHVRSPFNFSGYYANPTETDRALRSGWYRTGDLGYVARGELFVTGRTKDVMIVAGVNVYPHDVEAVVSRAGGVRPGRVSSFARFDERRATEAIIVLAESDLRGANAERAIVAIRQRLLAALHISNFSVHLVPPDWLVKSSSGKMAHRENRKKWEERCSALGADERTAGVSEVAFVTSD